MKGEKAVVILSGGQDSTTCLAQAVQMRGAPAVSCITFQYGQRHAHEVDVARAVATHFGVSEHRVIDLAWYSQITNNALLDPVAEIRQAEGAACPNTVVDGRNMLFLLAAAIYAKSRDIRDLIIGVSETDFSGYPDCRDIFIKSCTVTLNLAMDYPFRVFTPLMGLTKEETWALADSLGVLEYVAEHTLTCYNGVIGAGCGTCPSCELRRRGYEAYLARRKKGDLGFRI